MLTSHTPDQTNGIADAMHERHLDLPPLLDRAAEQAGALARRGLDAVRDSTELLRGRAVQASETTANYIKDEPLKSILVAAATGAALMALLSLLTRSRDRG